MITTLEMAIQMKEAGRAFSTSELMKKYNLKYSQLRTRLDVMVRNPHRYEIEIQKSKDNPKLKTYRVSSIIGIATPEPSRIDELWRIALFGGVMNKMGVAA